MLSLLTPKYSAVEDCMIFKGIFQNKKNDAISFPILYMFVKANRWASLIFGKFPLSNDWSYLAVKTVFKLVTIKILSKYVLYK